MALAQRRVVFKDTDLTFNSCYNYVRASWLCAVGGGTGCRGVPIKVNRRRSPKEGQLGGIDLNLTSQLVDAQTNLRALTARDSMAQTQQVAFLNRFPVLLAEYNRLPLVQINRDKLQQLVKAQQELSLEIARGDLTGKL